MRFIFIMACSVLKMKLVQFLYRTFKRISLPDGLCRKIVWSVFNNVLRFQTHLVYMSLKYITQWIQKVWIILIVYLLEISKEFHYIMASGKKLFSACCIQHASSLNILELIYIQGVYRIRS